jgi:CelD/BcsL family acetyltransferase involved in cellulose biosynthesis
LPDTLEVSICESVVDSAEDCAAWRSFAASSRTGGPLVDEPWVRAWIEAFRPQRPVSVCAREESSLVGLGLLQACEHRWAGRRLSVLQSLTNVESYRFDLLWAGDRTEVLRRCWEALLEQRRWDLLVVDHVPEDSPTLSLVKELASWSGWRFRTELTFESPWRPLSGENGWDANLKSKFKSNLRNRERRLAALGEVSFDVALDEDRLPEALAVFYELEAKSWKGDEGTAIAMRPVVKDFYDRLVSRAAPDVRIPVLRVAGRPVAAQVILNHGRSLFMLKTAYDPDFRAYSPGQLLTARVLRDGIEHGFEALDFLAANMAWKSDWSPRIRRHYRLMLFAPTFSGRYAYWTRYGLRDLARRVPGARRLVTRVRRWRGG